MARFTCTNGNNLTICFMEPSTPPPLPPLPPAPAKKNIFRTLATLCLLSPLVAVGFHVFMIAPLQQQHPAKSREEALVYAVLSGIVPGLGILAGLVSLLGIPRHGAAGILWKSLLGLLIWALLAWSAFSTIHKIEELARKRHEQQQAHAPP
jgi:hypothetical protein